jgi:hypothetical protein
MVRLAVDDRAGRTKPDNGLSAIRVAPTSSSELLVIARNPP